MRSSFSLAMLASYLRPMPSSILPTKCTFQELFFEENFWYILLLLLCFIHTIEYKPEGLDLSYLFFTYFFSIWLDNSSNTKYWSNYSRSIFGNSRNTLLYSYVTLEVKVTIQNKSNRWEIHYVKRTRFTACLGDFTVTLHNVCFFVGYSVTNSRDLCWIIPW